MRICDKEAHCIRIFANGALALARQRFSGRSGLVLLVLMQFWP